MAMAVCVSGGLWRGFEKTKFFANTSLLKPWQHFHLTFLSSSFTPLCSSSSRISAWFKFGSKGMDAKGAGIYGSQGRDDFNSDDVEQYFNYMGMLATEGSYEKMNELVNKGIHAVDILLLLASSEGDIPKIQELLAAGADSSVKDTNGRTALDRARNEQVRNLLQNPNPLNLA